MSIPLNCRMRLAPNGLGFFLLVVVQRKAVNCEGVLMKCIVIPLLAIPFVPSLVCWCHSDPKVATFFFNLFY